MARKFEINLQFYVFIHEGLNNNCGVLTNFYKERNKIV